MTLGLLLERLRMREHEIAVSRVALGRTAPKLPGGSLLERRTQPGRGGHIVEKRMGKGRSVDLRSDGSPSEQRQRPPKTGGADIPMSLNESADPSPFGGRI